MPNTLRSPQVSQVLDRLFAAAAQDDRGPQPDLPPDVTAQQLADARADAYMPVSPAGGALLYALVRAARPDTVVEFGLSFGISTIFLASAVRDNGIGHVVTTELSATKITAAQANLADAGLADLVTVLPGDAVTTLADVPGPIGLVLLDGWKYLCLPVLKLLEPKLAPGALVVGDDSSFEAMADYLAYVRDPANGYVTVEFPVEDGMEISVRA